MLKEIFNRIQFFFKCPSVKNSLIFIQLFIVIYAINQDTLKVFFLENAESNLFKILNLRSVETLFIMLGIGSIFFITRNETVHSNKWVRLLCVFFSVETVIGKSFLETQTWNYIFGSGRQLILAIIVMAGYYLVYKNSIALGQYIFRHNKKILSIHMPEKGFLKFFEEHCFFISFLFFFITSLPYLIFFFPGTLQPDAYAQLCMYFNPEEITGHHPVIITLLMGHCVEFGRNVFHSDTIGMFFYTGLQSVLQWLVFAYVMKLLVKIKTPILLKCFALLFFSVFPLFPMWGYTMVKDTGYYIFVLLFIASLAEIILLPEEKWGKILLIISSVGMGLFRNDGRYVVFLTLIIICICSRKGWKYYTAAFAACLLAVFLVEGIYMPINDIKKGSVREALSIPIQQTSRYVRMHYNEITPEEQAVLEDVFTKELEEIGNAYAPELSDTAKGLFMLYPSSRQLKDYFSVWYKQLLKHPGTYIQAFLNQTYGYFYPNREELLGYVCFFWFNGQYQMETPVKLNFGIRNPWGRDLLENFTNFVFRMPGVGMLYNAGFHIYILLGCAVFCLAKKKKGSLLIYTTSFCTLLVCLVSPVNAELRYMLPIIAALPLNLGVLFAEKKEVIEK